MPTYRRRTTVEAPIETVWRFHLDPRGLAAVSPDWLHLCVERVHGPDGETGQAKLTPGTTVEVSVQPGGIGPRQRWATRILDVERETGTAWFLDAMVGGPFSEWTHTHTFYADGGRTILRDRVEYELPLGSLRGPLGRLGVVGLAPMFRFRHRRTREVLASVDDPDRIDETVTNAIADSPHEDAGRATD